MSFVLVKKSYMVNSCPFWGLSEMTRRRTAQWSFRFLETRFSEVRSQRQWRLANHGSCMRWQRVGYPPRHKITMDTYSKFSFTMEAFLVLHSLAFVRIPAEINKMPHATSQYTRATDVGRKLTARGMRPSTIARPVCSGSTALMKGRPPEHLCLR